jgi:hypothetical protein
LRLSMPDLICSYHNIHLNVHPKAGAGIVREY